MSLASFRVASLSFNEHGCVVVQASVSRMKNIRSFIERLKRIGPRTEPCGTPLNISK